MTGRQVSRRGHHGPSERAAPDFVDADHRAAGGNFAFVYRAGLFHPPIVRRAVLAAKRDLSKEVWLGRA
ncbi:hypothetical protein GCM10007148_08420 [Parvularcula lutaonensis]|nr:hypothetical protein GCM10007148_08420 [Parvularcula lutaonensis]